MKLCVSQATTLATPFLDDLIAHADAGALGCEVWLTKLETYLDQAPLETLQAIVKERELALPVAAFQGGLLLSQGEARQSHFDHYKRRLELCQALGVSTIIVASEFTARPDATSLQRALVSLKQAAQWAAAFDVRVALEFRGSDVYASSLDTALNLIETVAEPNLGLCLDWFHFNKGPSKETDLERLNAGNLFHVQLCDVAGIPRELMTDGDRIFPGEGDFRTEALVATLRRIDYQGWVSVELFNSMLWATKPTQVVELALTSLRQLFA